MFCFQFDINLAPVLLATSNVVFNETVTRFFTIFKKFFFLNLNPANYLK